MPTLHARMGNPDNPAQYYPASYYKVKSKRDGWKPSLMERIWVKDSLTTRQQWVYVQVAHIDSNGFCDLEVEPIPYEKKEHVKHILGVIHYPDPCHFLVAYPIPTDDLNILVPFALRYQEKSFLVGQSIWVRHAAATKNQWVYVTIESISVEGVYELAFKGYEL